MADTASTTSRRTVIAAAGAAGLGSALAACGDSGGGSKDSDKKPPTQPAGQQLAKTSEIPVGGGKVFKDQKVVVTQPKEGQFEGFSAICTHQGCTVNQVSGGTINCPCHGSKFHIADGSVAGGPAPKPLPKVDVKVDGGAIKTV